jgi:hypothetical protein
MLARTPLIEIAIEEIDAVVRPLNSWQLARVGQVRGPNRAIAPLAFACGMSVKQFKRLPIEQQDQVRRAVRLLNSPRNLDGGVTPIN